METPFQTIITAPHDLFSQSDRSNDTLTVLGVVSSAVIDGTARAPDGLLRIGLV